MHDALVERTGVAYEPFTPEQQQGVVNMLERYVAAEEAEEEDILAINSFRDMLEVCKQFKKMVLRGRQEVDDARLEAQQAALEGPGRPLTGGDFTQADFVAESKMAGDFDPETPMVGETLGAKGFSMGTAAADSRPANALELGAESKFGGTDTGTYGSPQRAEAKGGMSPTRSVYPDSPGGDTKASASDFAPPGQGGAFDAFVRGEGATLYKEFLGRRANVKEIRMKMKVCTTQVNDAKRDIDRYQADIAERKQIRIETLTKSGLKANETEDIVDAEEFELMKQLKEVKRSYKNAYEQLSRLRGQLSEVQANATSAKEALAESFSQAQALAASAGFDAAGPDDELDDQEAFDRLEVQRVMESDPDSLAFFHAQKTRRANKTQNMTNIMQIKKNKRFT